MTQYQLETLVPSKAKAWVALIGSVLSLIIPYVLAISESLPEPWPAVIGVAVAVLTALGVYRAPYKPTDTVLAPKEAVPPEVPTDETPGVVAAPPTTSAATKAKSGWNPWKK